MKNRDNFVELLDDIKLVAKSTNNAELLKRVIDAKNTYRKELRMSCYENPCLRAFDDANSRPSHLALVN